MRLPWRRRYSPRIPFTRAELAALWIRAGGNPARAQLAAAVALAESAGNPDAIAPDGRVGPWQLPASAGANLLDPVTNATAAVALSAGGEDWSQFPGYVNGAYRQFAAEDGQP